MIIWDWSVVSHNSDESDESDRMSEVLFSDDGDNSTSSDEVASEPNNVSCLDFKCIGVTQESVYQQTLEQVRDRLQSGEKVPVRLLPEPENPYDSKAIAFQCFHLDGWRRIGYVVAELCEEVLSAINSGDILSVEFAWVKFKLLKNRPGYYASIFVTRKGEWSNAVKRSKNSLS